VRFPNYLAVISKKCRGFVQKPFPQTTRDGDLALFAAKPGTGDAKNQLCHCRGGQAAEHELKIKTRALHSTAVFVEIREDNNSICAVYCNTARFMSTWDQLCCIDFYLMV
jgi:hypothetical protein